MGNQSPLKGWKRDTREKGLFWCQSIVLIDLSVCKCFMCAGKLACYLKCSLIIDWHAYIDIDYTN